MGERRLRQVALALGFAALATYGAPATALELAPAVEEGLALHPDVQRALAQLEAANQSVVIARSGLLPAVNFDAAYGGQWIDSPSTRLRDERYRGLRSKSVNLAVRQLLFDGQRTGSGVQAAMAERAAAGSLYRDAAERVARAVAQAYLALLEADETLAAARRNVAEHETVLETIEARIAQTLAAPADRLQVVSRLARAQETEAVVAGRRAEAAATLRELIGKVPETVARPILAASAEFEQLEEALSLGQEINPVVEASAARAAARKAEVAVARAAFLPSVSVELTGAWNDDVEGVEGTEREVRALLSFSWNLYDGGADRARTSAAQAQARAATSLDEDLRRRVREQVRISFRNRDSDRRRLVPLAADVMAQEEVYEAFASQYEIGQRSLLDLLDARTQLFNSEAQLIAGEIGVIASELDLRSAAGLLLESLAVAAPAFPEMAQEPLQETAPDAGQEAVDAERPEIETRDLGAVLLSSLPSKPRVEVPQPTPQPAPRAAPQLGLALPALAGALPPPAAPLAVAPLDGGENLGAPLDLALPPAVR